MIYHVDNHLVNERISAHDSKEESLINNKGINEKRKYFKITAGYLSLEIPYPNKKYLIDNIIVLSNQEDENRIVEIRNYQREEISSEEVNENIKEILK